MGLLGVLRLCEGYSKLKYPTISQQETALKFLALGLKANNPNREEYYRQKYQKKMKEFQNGCNLSQAYYQEHLKRGIIGDGYVGLKSFFRGTEGEGNRGME